MTMPPSNWTSVTLSQLSMGGTEKIDPQLYPNRHFELWSVPAFPTNAPELVYGKDIGAAKQRVQPGDVLLCKINPRINRVWVVRNGEGFEQIASTEWIVFRTPEISPEFLAYAFRERNFRSHLTANVSGVGGSLTRARPADIASLEIAIAPLNEQRRIVTKLDALFEKSHSIREKLDRLPRLLANLQKSILNSAFRGDLTREWRANNPNVESASELLKQIRAERRTKWEADLIAKGKDPKKAKYIEPTPADTKGLPQLPEGWSWATIPMIASAQPNALKAGPFGSSLKKSDYTEHGFKVYGQEQVIRGNPYFGDYFIPKEKFQELSNCAVSPGDILISLVGTAGKVLVLPQDAAPGIINPRLVKISVAQKQISPNYVARYIQSSVAQRFLRETAHGGTMEILNLGILKQLVVPIPPLEEQQKIVETIATFEVRLGEISSLLEVALQKRRISEQALLTKAFRGELVPQDPNDEPASELLERIRSQKSAAGEKRRRGRKAAM